MKPTRTANHSLPTLHAAILIVALNVAAFGQMECVLSHETLFPEDEKKILDERAEK